MLVKLKGGSLLQHWGVSTNPQTHPSSDLLIDLPVLIFATNTTLPQFPPPPVLPFPFPFPYSIFHSFLLRQLHPIVEAKFRLTYCFHQPQNTETSFFVIDEFSQERIQFVSCQLYQQSSLDSCKAVPTLYLGPPICCSHVL